ncbi:MAG: phosphodiester glycosidase family protein [Lentisphaeria bacterium]|nr:phosphodiester glycosidase family protein [Lentisphaeria bacterium]
MKKQSKQWWIGGLILALMLGCLTVSGKGLEGEMYKNPKVHRISRIQRGAEMHYYEFADLFGKPQAITVIYLDWNRDWNIGIGFCGEKYRTVPDMAKENNADIAINGSFFVMKTPNKPTSAGELKIDGKELFPTNPKWSAFIGFDNRRDLPQVTPDNPVTENVMQLNTMLLVNGEALTQYPWKVAAHPRAAIGVTDDNKLVLIAIDGRHPGRAHGTTFPETAQICKDLGCRNAINLDGGGSTTLYVRNYGVVNHPSDNKKFDNAGSRPVNDCLYFTYGKKTERK